MTAFHKKHSLRMKTVSVFLTLVMLLTVLLQAMPVVAVAWEPDSYTTISANSSVSVSITSANSAKYYKFVPAASGTYSFYSTNSNGDPRGALVDANGSTLASNDDASGRDFQFTYACVARQTYYVKAYMYSSYTGSYTLNVQTISLEESVPVASDQWDGTVATAFAGGSGTESNPYLISTAEQLAYLAQQVNGGTTYAGNSFKLTANIDLNNLEWAPIGKGTLTAETGVTSNYFSGNFDGDYHIVSNLKVHNNDTTYAGLFGDVVAGSISNLGLENTDIDLRTSARSQAGSLAGRLHSSIATNCYVKNAKIYVSSTSDPTCGGGLIGTLTASKVLNCYATATIDGYGTVGGLVASCYDGSTEVSSSVVYSGKNRIEGSYAAAQVHSNGLANGQSAATPCVGGVLGYCDKVETIKNCFFVGSLSGSGVRTGAIYADDRSATISNCYYSCTGGSLNVTAGTATSSENFRSASWVESSLGWNFTNLWQMDPEGDNIYPVLRNFEEGSVPSPAPIPPAASEFWDGTVATAFAGGSGTESNPYLISTAEQLAYLAQRVNGGTTYVGNFFKLTANIDLNNLEWTPIGKGTLTDSESTTGNFAGNFDGDFHIIYNLKVRNTATSYAGLFGIAAGEIKNLGIETTDITVDVTREAQTGNIAGFLYGGTISHCYVRNGQIVAQSDQSSVSGGLVGMIDGNGSIRDCYATGSVGGNGYTGGIVGAIFGSGGGGTVTTCYFNGELTNTGTVSGGYITPEVGGIGNPMDSSRSSLSSSFFVGTLIAQSNAYLGAINGDDRGRSSNCYYASSTNFDRYGGTSETESSFQSQSWLVSNLSWDFQTAWTFDTASGYLYPVLRNFEEGSVPSPAPIPPAASEFWNGSIAGAFEGGSGTESNPYLIATEAQLAYLAQQVNAGNSYDGKYFQLTDDLDLNNLEWTPIGKGTLNSDITVSDSYFSGYFDGNGHVISNLKVTQNDTSYAGLFGDVVSGMITRLGLDGVEVRGEMSLRSHAGGIAGRLHNSILGECYVTNATIYASSTTQPAAAGGLVGCMIKASLTNCYVSGTAVDGYGTMGGLVGALYGGVTNVYGIYSGGNKILNSYALADVHSNGRMPEQSSGMVVGVGGLVGFYGSAEEISSCYFVGALSGEGDIGSLCANLTELSFANCYYYTESEPDYVTGTATTTRNLQSINWLISHMNWSEDIWTINTASDYEYPMLIAFDASAVPEHTHVERDWVVTVLPDCLTEGVKVLECAICGSVLETGAVAALGHHYAVTSTVDPTCTADGEMVFTCDRENCTVTKLQILLASGHSFGDDSICDLCHFEAESHTHTIETTVVEATCLQAGYTEYFCACGYSYRANFVDLRGHRWSGEITTAKTCTRDGVTTYTCSECGTFYTVTIPAAHNWTETVTDAATCTADGSLYRVCSNCGTSETVGIPAAHAWDEGTVKQEASCTETGLRELTCTACGETEERVIDALGHRFVDGACTECKVGITEAIRPDTQHPQYGMYFEVDDVVSGYGPDEINEYGVLLDYNSDAIITKVAVFLTQDGTMWRRCIACVGRGITYANYVPYLSYDEEIKYSGLNSEWINVFRLQENSDGIWCYNDYATIGVNLEDQYGNLLLSLYDIGEAGTQTRVFTDLNEMVEWLKDDTCYAHIGGEWVVDTEATCTTEGSRHRDCVICDEQMTQEVIPLLAHEESEWIVEVEETCTTDGSRYRICEICNATTVAEEVPATGHNWEDYTFTSEVSCRECTDHAVARCLACGEEQMEEGLGHEESDWMISVYPTPTTSGVRYKTCLRGGSIVCTEEIDPLAQITVETVSTVAGATVNVAVDIRNNPGILGAVLTLNYDDSLTLLEVTSGSAWRALTLTKPEAFSKSCSFAWAGETAATDDGTVIVLTFAVPKDAPLDTEYNVGITCNWEDILNAEGESVELAIVDGSIRIVEQKGDVNGDGVVDCVDVILLRRYMAGEYPVTVDESKSDMNGDGKLTVSDVIRLRQAIVNGQSK